MSATPTAALVEEAEKWSQHLERDDFESGAELNRQEASDLTVCLDKMVVALRCAEAERDEARAELARLTTPRPIEEAPKDGTWVVVCWDMQPHEAPIVVQAAARGWWDGLRYVEPQPTHFLPLPVKP